MSFFWPTIVISIRTYIIFIIYYDLPLILPSNIHIVLLADDIKIYFSYCNMDQRDHLQNAINLFSNWSKTWQLNLAIHKCVVLSIGKITPLYYSLLITVENIKDLGISFSNTLSFNIHKLSAEMLNKLSDYIVKSNSIVYFCFT